jgi:hypothetical protein
LEGQPGVGGKRRVAANANRRPIAHFSRGAAVNELLADLAGKGIGSSGRTRTYNPSVNSRMLYH